MYNLKTYHFNLILDDNQDNDKNQKELQNANPTLDTQSTDPTIDSNAVLVLVRHVEEQDIRQNTEQYPQYLFQVSSTLSTTNSKITQPPISRSYDPPPLPEPDTFISSSTSQQSSTFNNNIIGLLNNTRP